MKKFLFALLAIIAFNVASFAQTTTKSKMTAKSPKMETKAKMKTTATGDQTVKMKKNGTPDMRYKENKQKKVAVTGPKKKNGTPDMRYKANKKS
jgi:hypothetical protein